MEHINEMFWRTLFVERHVMFNSAVFNELHHIIFPDINQFDAFLHADTTEKMVATAKIISSSVLFSTCISPTPAMYHGLIDAESNYPAADEQEFVSQDHVIHSLNVYLLGIYIFFNHQLLHDRVYEWFKSDLCEFNKNIEKMAVLQFIDAWKLFAFCHDIGYPFEKLTNKNCEVRTQAVEMFERYQALGNELKYDRIMRSIAVLMFASVICKRSTKSLGNVLEKCSADWRKSNWIGPGGNKLSWDNTPLTEWRCYFKLYCIHTKEDFACLYPLITSEDLAVVVRDKHDTIVGMQVKKSDDIFTLAFTHNFPSYNFTTYDGDEFHCDFYCKDPISTLNRNSIPFHMSRFLGLDQWMPVAEFFCEPEISMMGNNKRDCRNVLHTVYCKLREHIKVEDANASYSVVRDRYTGHRPDMATIILNKLKDKLSSEKRCSRDYETDFDQICGIIQKSLKEEDFFDSTIKAISSEVNPPQERWYIVWNILHSAFTKNWDDVNTIELPHLFSSEFTDNKYICLCDPFVFPGNTPSAFAEKSQQVNNALKNYLVDLGMLPQNESISYFTQYTHKKTRYDHGILGAHILSYTASLQAYFEKTSSFKICSQNATRLQTSPLPSQAIIEGLGAILVHNIYTERYKEITGMDFMLTLDEHPLAFLGAFCDALQIWDRHHSVDQSTRSLTVFNPSRMHVALEVHGKDIVITCETNNNKKTGQNQRSNLLQFLKCGAEFLKVNFIEEPI